MQLDAVAIELVVAVPEIVVLEILGIEGSGAPRELVLEVVVPEEIVVLGIVRVEAAQVPKEAVLVGNVSES